MTLIKIDLRNPALGGGDLGAVGYVKLSPTARRHTDGTPDWVTLPTPVYAHLGVAYVGTGTVQAPQFPAVRGVAYVDSAPTLTGEWCWKSDEKVTGGTVRYVAVPNAVGPIDYGDLADVDPTTLGPTVPVTPAWQMYVAGEITADRPNGTPAWGAVTGKPAMFPPAAPGKNMVDVATGQDNYFWNDGDSTPLALATYWASDKFAVTPGATYTTQGIRSIQFFDSAGLRVPGTLYINDSTYGTNTVTVPASRPFMAVSTLIAKKGIAQVESGSSATSYEPYGVKVQRLLANGSYVDAQLASLAASTIANGGDLTIYKSGNTLALRHPHDSTTDLLLPINLAGTAFTPGDLRVRQSITGLTAARTIAKTTTDAAIWPLPAPLPGTQIHSSGDDNAPIYAGGSYIGGNHGWNHGTQVTMTGHGKIAADLGSQWSDGTRTYTLLRIIDANILLFGNPYTVTSGRVSGGITVASTTLTHLSGATNTASVTISGGISLVQIRPTSHTRTVTCTLDGAPIGDGTARGRVLRITETYTLVSYKGLIDYSQTNIGVDPFADLTLLSSHSRISTSWRFEGRNCVVGQTATALEAMSMFVMVSQAIGINLPTSGSLRQYLPGLTGTKVGLNLATEVNLTTAQSGDLATASTDQINAADPASRVYQWAYSSGGARQYGLMIGLLPVMDGKHATRVANGTNSTSWYLVNSTKKNYPRLTGPAMILALGNTLSGLAVRRYLSPEDPTEVVVSDGSRMWVFIDTPTASASPKIAAVPQAQDRALAIKDTGSTVTTAKPYVTPEGITYTNTAPGYLLAEAVIDSTV